MVGALAGLVLLAIPAGAASWEPPSTPSVTQEIDATKELRPETIKWLSLWFADAYGANRGLVDEILSCESNYDPKAKNPSSTASGLFQIVKGTWEHFECTGDVFDVEDNLMCGMKILTTSGKQHWSECL